MKNLSTTKVKTTGKKAKQRFAIVSLYGQTIVLKYRGKKRYSIATPKELGITSDSHLATEDAIASIDKKLDKSKVEDCLKLEFNNSTAKHSPLALLQHLSVDNMTYICDLFFKFPLLCQSSVAPVSIMLIALAGKVLSELHEAYPDLRLICGITPANPKAMETLEAILEPFHYNERYKDKHFKAYNPLVVSPVKDAVGWGSILPSTRMADYSYVDIKLKNGQATLFLPYLNTSAIIADGFPNDFAEKFVEQNPESSVFLLGYSNKKLSNQIIVDGNELSTVDEDILKNLQDNSKYLAALIDLFVQDFKSSPEMFEKLTKNINDQLKSTIDDHYTSYRSDPSRQMWTILLALYDQFLNWCISKEYCSSDAAQSNLDVVTASVNALMENADSETTGKPVQIKAKEKIEDLRVFLNFACEWIQRNRGNICLPNEETKPGCSAKLYDIEKKGRYMVFREEPLLKAYLWWCQLKGIDMSFCKSDDSKKLLEEFQKQSDGFHCNCAPRCKLKFYKGDNEYVICIQANRLLEHANKHKIEVESVLAGLMSETPN